MMIECVIWMTIFTNTSHKQCVSVFCLVCVGGGGGGGNEGDELCPSGTNAFVYSDSDIAAHAMFRTCGA